MARPNSSRPFRFGISAHVAPSATAWRDLAIKAEDLGYGTLLVSDHLGPQFAPLPAITAAAAATRSLRVGTQVLSAGFRNPVVLAKELTTVDVLSEGRLDWGMGAGWLTSDYEATGIDYETGPDRYERLAEAIGLMKRVFAGGPVDHEGRIWSVRGAQGNPPPVQKPHPPLIVGATHRRTLQLAGREADIVGISAQHASRQFGPFPATIAVEDSMDQQIAWVREGAGDRFDELELSSVIMPLNIGAPLEARDPSELEGAARAAGLTPAEALRSPHLLVGSVDEACELLKARRDRWGISNWVIPAARLEAFAPVVDRLTGC